MQSQNTNHYSSIKAIMGLGNPGPKYAFTPHNIGFLIIDALCETHHGSWSEKDKMAIATIQIHNRDILLIKPLTFMNNSGEVLPQLQKRGIKQENILVVHDEIDYAFGQIKFKEGGSARGHNGLRSLIAHGGDNFLRLRCGVGRPKSPEDVGEFVTAPFQESQDQITGLIQKAIDLISNKII